MKITHRVFYISTVILMTCFTAAAQVSLFPQHPESKNLSAETLPYSQMLHSGVENDTFYMRGRFGVDFPVVGYEFGERHINFGITAATHINMRPTSGGRFPVDNFYAVLSIYFSGDAPQNFSWRLYPVYHVSAHLADGYRGGDILRDSVRAVSSEMVFLQLYHQLTEHIELGGGAGWYYHVCAQKELSHRFEASILLKTDRALNADLRLLPFALLRGETVYQGQYYGGLDAMIGAAAFGGNGRGLGLAFRYFNRLHSSYYFERYEKGLGGEILFFM